MRNCKELAFLLLNIGVQLVHGFDEPVCDGDRSVMIHMFNWKHSDIAIECERWLGPKGYCAAQVTPPSEHIVYTNYENPTEHRPWWERYQPVSYILGSRSGDRAAFEDMVNRCNAVGVKIYAEMIVNHLTGAGNSGIGSAGSEFDTATLTYPSHVENDFNCCSYSGQGNCDAGKMCNTADCSVITNDAEEVRDCRLFTLADLALGVPETRNMVRAYFEDMISIGVSGFSIDAARNMWPEDIEALIEGLTLPDGSQPFIYNEVIDLGGGPISGDEYLHLGRVTEFKYCNNMFGFRGNFALANYINFGEAWGMYPSGKALVFVDNHDNQRGHGSGGEEIITFWEPYYYKMAIAFALAHPYGAKRLISSYRWPGGRLDNDAYGPPTNDGDDIKDVTINPDETCEDGTEHTWVCEHRWPSIAHMVEWHNVVGGEGDTDVVDNWWSNGNNQIAFSRSGAGFIAFNTEGSDMSETLQTGLPQGSYCNIIKAHADNCADHQVTVNADGTATISITASDEEPMVAIHTGAGSLINKA